MPHLHGRLVAGPQMKGGGIEEDRAVRLRGHQAEEDDLSLGVGTEVEREAPLVPREDPVVVEDLEDQGSTGQQVLATGLREHLLPGAPLILQILNYDRIFAGNERSLPLNFRSDPEGEIVFLRLMTPQPDGTVLFYPTTLHLRPGHEPAVEVRHTREVHLRGWRREEVEAALERAGFSEREAFNGFDGGAWEATSRDLLLVAR